MGIFHAENMSKRMFIMLYHERFEHGLDKYGDLLWMSNKRKKPRPISIGEFVNYFMVRLETCKKALKYIPNSIWGKNIFQTLMEHEFSYNASDGSFLEKCYIEDGVNTIINIWEDTNHWGLKIIDSVNKNSKIGYVLTEDALKTIIKNGNLFSFKISEVDM